MSAGKVQQVVEKIEKKLEEIDDNVLQYCSLDNQVIFWQEEDSYCGIFGEAW